MFYIKKKIVLILTTLLITLFSFISYAGTEPVNKGKSFTGNTSFEDKKTGELPKVESKLDTKLAKLIGKAPLLPEETKSNIIKSLKDFNAFNSKGTPVKGTRIKASSDAVYVYIKTKTSQGFKDVAPYILKVTGFDEKNNLMVAWIEIDHLAKLDTLIWSSGY